MSDTTANGHDSEFVKSMMGMYDDLPDGAFFAVMEEHGIYPEDMEDITWEEDEDA